MRGRRRRKKDNRGVSLVMVISTVALVSVLVLVVLSVSLMNMQMKAVYKGSVDNFYDAEAAMDEIRAGLQQEVSLAATEAYAEVMDQYSATDYQNEMRRNMFRSAYRARLKERLGQALDPGKYDIARLQAYIGEEHRYQASTGLGADLHTVSGREPELAVTDAGIVIKDLELIYRDGQDYVSVVNTDIVLAYPEISFIQSASVPDLLSYCIVADDGVTADNGNRTVTLSGNVYAGDYGASGEGGFTVENSGTAVLGARQLLITRGGLNVRENGSFTTGSKITLWADNLNLWSNSQLQLSGTAYVADDLTIVGSGDVTLQGEYYGYGNPNSAKLASSVSDEEVNGNESAYSSAMIVNGVADAGKASIHMDGLSRLMLAGNAYIGSGSAMMGESLAVKSSQTAYLAPSDCFLVETTNPTPDLSTQLQEPDYLDLGALERYHAIGVVRQVSPDGLAYYFLEFRSAADAAAFDAEYFSDANHAAQREQYLQLYVDEQALTIRETAAVEKIVNGAIMVWDQRGIRTIDPGFEADQEDITDDTYYAMTQAGWQDMYSAYNRCLTQDYIRLTEEQRNSTVFENLVDVDALTGLISAGSQAEYFYEDGSGERYSAYVVNNPTAVFTVDQTFLSGKNVSLIIAVGDVRVTTDYEGLILSGGKISLENIEGAQAELTADRDGAAAVIQQAQYTSAGNVYSLRELLTGYEYYVGGSGTGAADSMDVTELVTYTNWSKE